MKYILIALLFNFLPLASNAQLGLDFGVKMSSIITSRYQVEQRFHFEDKITFIMDFGYNKWKMPTETNYLWDDYHTSALILPYYTTDYFQYKIGLQKKIINNPHSSVYTGFSIGINNERSNFYLAYSPVSYVYNSVLNDYELAYVIPKSTRSMDYQESTEVKEFITDIFLGLDYNILNDLFAITLATHGSVNYIYKSKFAPMQRFHVRLEMNAGIRYLIKR